MKKILMLSTSLKTRGGISAVVSSYLSSNLIKDFNIKIIETHIDKSYYLKTIYFFRSLFYFVIFSYESNIIHIHLSEPISLLRKLPFFIISKIIGKKVICHLHAPGNIPSLNKYFYLFYKYVFTISEKIIVLSFNWKEMIKIDFKINSNKIAVVQNPCAPIFSKQKFQKKNYILFAGTLNERKNYKTLIRAFSKISKEFHDWKLLMAGNGEIKEAKLLVKKLNLSEKVKFLGWIKGEVKHKIFSEASIFCLPSYAEGLPMAILDAFSYNIPVISSNVGGIVDFVKHEENILLFDPYDKHQLYQCLKLLIKNDSVRDKITAGSAEFSKKIFSLENISKKISTIYNEI